MYEFFNTQFNAFFHIEFYYGVIYGIMMGVIAAVIIIDAVNKGSKKETETTVIALPAPEEPETEQGEEK